jgi:light-regulated signal transduction histidine kinase (bacteriophytochrome)
MADESQMIQLIQNLIENSIKFSHGIPEITISAGRNNDQHIFSVKDKGIGIEPQYFERIFRIFQRLHRSEEYEGTGIGLAICKRIVERHGGQIWIESAYNEGATFYFSLPVMIPNNST